MKTSKKQFKSLANRLFCLVQSNEDKIPVESRALIYRTIAADYALNFAGATAGWYGIQYKFIQMHIK